MNCSGFDKWIERGAPRDNRTAAARRHAAHCARCLAILESDEAIADVFRQRFATLPVAFTDKIMTRLPRQDEPDLAQIATQVELGTPWWAQLFVEPTIVFSLSIGVIGSIWGPALFAHCSELVQSLTTRPMLAVFVESLSLTGSPSWVIPTVLTSVVLGMACLLYQLTLSLMDTSQS